MDMSVFLLRINGGSYQFRLGFRVIPFLSAMLKLKSGFYVVGSRWLGYDWFYY